LAARRLNSHRRVAQRAAVDATLRTGESVRTPFFRLAYRIGGGPPGVAFLAGGRVGGAVKRNRARRVLREAYRTSEADLSGVETLVLVAADKAATARYGLVRDALWAALGRVSDRVSNRGNGKAAPAA